MFEITQCHEILSSEWIKEEIPQLSKIKKALERCKELGLKGQILELKKKAVATILESRNMCLLEILYIPNFGGDREPFYSLNIMMSNGQRKVVESPTSYMMWGNHYDVFSKYKMNEFKGNIPLEIIEQLPNNIQNHAVIFAPQARVIKDPIIAIKLKDMEDDPSGDFLYAGIFKWE